MSAVFEIMGTTGSFIICASAIPQVVKTCRIKRSRDLSIAYLSVLMLGISLLQSYSLYVRDSVLILGNTLSMLSTGLLIVLWFKYRDRPTSAQSLKLKGTDRVIDPPSPLRLRFRLRQDFLLRPFGFGGPVHGQDGGQAHTDLFHCRGADPPSHKASAFAKASADKMAGKPAGGFLVTPQNS